MKISTRARKKKGHKAILSALLATPVNVGGQAVIEGVMMRSPKAMAIVVRKADGRLAIKEEPWRSLSERLSVLKLPLLRGIVVLFEALINGFQALHYSATQAMEDVDDHEDKKAETKSDSALSNWAITGTLALSFLLGCGLFIVLPHLLSGMILKMMGQENSLETFAFHAIDGAIKMVLFLTYVWAIGRMKDIKRVFQYHGAEHKSIYAYEANKELTVDNARPYSTLHPRCGTAFIMVVLMVSIGMFAALLPLFTFPGSMPIKTVLAILAKIALMLPIAGIGYEIIKFSSNKKTPFLKWLIIPGLLMQKITTKDPTDDQIEVALEALKRALAIEGLANQASKT